MRKCQISPTAPVKLMKPVELISLLVLLLLGTISPTLCAKQEPQQQEDKKHKPQPQPQPQPQQEDKQHKQEQKAKPEKQQEAKPQKQEEGQAKSQQEQEKKQKQENKQQPQNKSTRQEQEAKPQRQEQPQVNGQQKQQQAVWQGHRAHDWKSEHRDWQQRGGYNGYRIPEDRYRGYFGPSHAFRMYSYPVVVVGGYPRFQYDGFWFSVVDPWPEYWSDDWYDNDDIYIEDYGGGYYLYNRRYPQDRIAVIVAVN